MFQDLVESTSHSEDIRRKGLFFVGTLAAYGALLLAAGVASIYAYNVHLADEEFEMAMLVDPSTFEISQPSLQRPAKFYAHS